MSDMGWGCVSVGTVVFITVLIFLAIKTTGGPRPASGNRGSISHVRNGHVRVLHDADGNVKQTAGWSNDFNQGHYEDGGLLHRVRSTGTLDNRRGFTPFGRMTPGEQDARIEELSRK